MYKIILIFFSIGTLVSCSSPSYYTTNGEKHYLNSHHGETIIVPAPMTKSNISDFYTLPAQTQDAVVDVLPPTDQRSGYVITRSRISGYQ
ncbi:MAG: hypothetical protein ACOVQX_04695 [Legionella sp.]